MHRASLATATVAACAALWPPLVSRAAAQSWTPPIGIPAPAFGIVEKAPPAPNPWTVPVAGFYFVDAAKPAATDNSNPFGTPARPRRTIPRTLPAGSVVELRGTYDASHTSPATIVAQGTAAQPVFIRGAGATSRPLIRNGWELKGTYAILEFLEFGPLNSTQTGALMMLSPSHHLTVRDSDFHGNLSHGGIGVQSWDGNTVQHVVIHRNVIHDNGDLAATYDQDIHGILVGARVSHVWILENQLARNSGDGIQIGAGSAGLQSTTHHVYVGRNVAFHNKQTGVWAKQAIDVIVSQNLCYGHRPGNSSSGQCMGYQYATERIWFIANHVEDSEFGIAAMSDNGLGIGSEAYFVGNVIHNIHASGGSNPGTAWSSAAIMLAGGVNRYVVGNTIYDVDAGVNVPSAGGSLAVVDNIVARVTVPAGNHLFVEIPSLASRTVFRHNLLEGDARTKLGGGQKHWTPAELVLLASLEADPRFVDPPGHDFYLQSGSPAVNAGNGHTIYAAFEQRYGLHLAVGPDGTLKPQGGAFDMGAYEVAACSPTSVPSAPTNLRASISGNIATIAWNPAVSCPPVTSYVLEGGTRPGAQDIGVGIFPATTISFTSPFPPGVYYIRARGRNSMGTGAPSNEIVVAIGGVPAAPLNLTPVVANGILSLSWTPRPMAARQIYYRIEAGTGPSLSERGTGLVLGTRISAPTPPPASHYVRVRAGRRTTLSVGDRNLVRRRAMAGTVH